MWDLPGASVRRTYVIASTPRTGSTLFANALWDTGRVGAPKEYLNPMQRRDFAVRFGTPVERAVAARLTGPLLPLATLGGGVRAHLDRVLAVRTAADGWFGLKLHHHHFEALWHEVEALLAPVAWVHVSRADRVAQAISWERALQTGRWASFQRAWGPAVYSRSRLQRRLDAIARAEAGWEAFFHARRIAPLHVSYEAFADGLGPSVRAALRHLGEPDDVPEPLPSQVRQADATSVHWRTRFLAGSALP